MLLLPIESTEQERQALRQAMGFDDPLIMQYWRFVKRAVDGDFGNSFFIGQPALEIIMERMPATLQLTLAGMGISLVLASLEVARNILREAFLSFLGLGIQPPTPSWGGMLSEGRVYMLNKWWLATFPGLAIFCTTLGINLLGDGLRDLLDPHLDL